MTHIKKLILLIGSYLMCTASLLTLAGETKTVFTSPGMLCFPQTALRAELERYNNVILDHFVVISKKGLFSWDSGLKANQMSYGYLVEQTG
mgnify:CR=1 FL=1